MEKTFSYLEREAGIVVEDGCWVYIDEATGAKVKVSRPEEVLGVLRNSFDGCEMLLLKSVDLSECGENGLVLCVYNDRSRVWHKVNLPVKRREVRLPISDLRYLPVWFDLNLDFEFDESKFGDWKLTCTEWLERDEQKKMLDFYRKVEKLLGIAERRSVLKWLKNLL